MLDALQSCEHKDVLFTPLYGHDDSCEAVSSVLKIGGVTILLDCGWTDECDIDMLAPLAAVAPMVDLARVDSGLY
jgi:cleavage and polyadenylation specificity factor subunit 2